MNLLTSSAPFFTLQGKCFLYTSKRCRIQKVQERLVMQAGHGFRRLSIPFLGILIKPQC